MSDVSSAAKQIAEYSYLVDKARKILSGAPYWMSADDEGFAKLEIGGDTATLSWPEIQSGYYDSSSIETQTAKFPAGLLLLTMDGLERWKAEEKQKYELEKAAAAARDAAERADRKTREELKTLVVLAEKYKIKLEPPE